MALIKGLCGLLGDELRTLLVMDKRVHHTLVYGITHLRNRGRQVVRRTSDLLILYSQED